MGDDSKFGVGLEERNIRRYEILRNAYGLRRWVGSGGESIVIVGRGCREVVFSGRSRFLLVYYVF